MTHDPLIHIHATPGAPCVACGDADTSDTDFVLDTGYWNTLNRRCSPSTIVSPAYEVTGREDPRTSALLGERRPSSKKVSDRR